MELIEVACQGKSGFLDPGDPDMSVESFSAGKELKVEVLTVVIVEILNRYADHSALVRVDEPHSGSIELLMLSRFGFPKLYGSLSGSRKL